MIYLEREQWTTTLLTILTGNSGTPAPSGRGRTGARRRLHLIVGATGAAATGAVVGTGDGRSLSTGNPF